MHVTKRNFERKPLCVEKLRKRLVKLAEINPELNGVDTKMISECTVNAGIYDGVSTRELDTLAMETSAGKGIENPEYSQLAGRIMASRLHKEVPNTFTACIEMMRSNVNSATGEVSPLIHENVYNVIRENETVIENAIDKNRDFGFDYFGIQTLVSSYLSKVGENVVESPQYMMMRVSIGIHSNDVDKAIETYNYMSQGWFIHATPTLFNAGTLMPQLSSCFLVSMKEDSIEGIYDTLRTCALISKHAGGIGFHAHNVRAKGSYISGTNGISNGLVPMLRVFNNTAQYVDQGGGKRKGSFACYLEPWHADVFEWLELKRNHGAEEIRARDLFYALWIPDLFMKRVENDLEWTLMCPAECPGLADCHGEEFERLYTSYEKQGKGRKTIRAQTLWSAIMQSQIETGTPYMLYKDACNKKSNQQNLGTIKSSNLCTEIIEYTDKDEVAVCNLASISLPKFVKENGQFDFEKLRQVSKVVCRNLNRIIDINHYPVPEAERSNKRHRPIGIGVQGLADMFALMRLPFDSAKAKTLNRDIFETIYYGAVEASTELAEIDGPYETFKGSPSSSGVLQFDMWNVTPSDRWDWEKIKDRVKRVGLRNSLLMAPMPTASTAQILGNTECFEPYQSNVYTRRVLRGEFLVVNKHLIKDLMGNGLWNEEMRNRLVQSRGSIQGMTDIPADIREIYKTVWEISMKTLIDMAVDRGAFIDQSQSFNTFMAHPTLAKLSSMHFYGWKRGLKTGQYYLREKPAANAVQFTVDPSSAPSCPLAPGDGVCMACSA